MDNPAASNVLAYIDQASLQAAKAVGREPMAQFNWLYEHDVDFDALQRFQRNLAQGLLGRRIECSPLPFGRHRWVFPDEQATLDVSTRERTRDQAAAWFDERALLPIDAELGPSWHFGVQPLVGGGAAMSLVASHSVADALGMCLAVKDAVDGVTHDFGYPPPASRTRMKLLREDLGVFVRSVPDMAKAAIATVAVARGRSGLMSSVSGRAPARMPSNDAQARFVVPGVTAFVDIGDWDERARALGGTSNSLVAGVVVRFAAAIGRVNSDGKVNLAFPVSERVEGDTRANALTQVEIMVDPTVVTTDLGELRRELKAALSTLRENPNFLFGPIALTPLVPKALIRRLERVIVSGKSVGCSSLGNMDPSINRPDGTDAEQFWIRPVEAEITEDIINGLGGRLILVSGRLNGTVHVSLRAWRPGGTNRVEDLRRVLARVFDEFDLPYTFYDSAPVKKND